MAVRLCIARSGLRRLRVVAVLSAIALAGGCAVEPANQPPAPVVSGVQNFTTSEGPPPEAVPTRNYAAVRSTPHRLGVASLKSKRHARIGKKSSHVKTARHRVPHGAAQQEAAANAGVVHHIGPKIVPLE